MFIPSGVPILDVDALRVHFPEWVAAEERCKDAPAELRKRIMESARAATQAPSGRVADKAQQVCVSRHYSFIVDSTLRKREWAQEEFSKMHSAGYTVLLVFIDTSEDVCQE